MSTTIRPRQAATRFRRRRLAQGVNIWLLALPALAAYAVFLVSPAIQSIWISLTNWNGIAPTKTFVGLDNFLRLATDAIFWKSLGRNLLIAATAIVLQVFLALLIAYCLVRIVPFVSRLFLFFYLVPDIGALARLLF